MMKEYKSKTRTLLNVFLAGFGVGLIIWVFYLNNFAFLCRWHFEDSEARFLVLGDPQMEGDSRVLRQGIYGHIDLMYNDAYFRHIVSNIMKYLAPTHVFVLGDLFSSQHVSDSEFNNRLQRYQYIFESVKVPLYNITGNHDLGYAGEVTPQRIARFEQAFGKVNDEVVIADHVVGIVNSINIDSSHVESLQRAAWDHMKNLSATSKDNNMPLIMMTHIPLHKETFEEKNDENIFAPKRSLELCAERSYTRFTSSGHIDTQNMLLPNSSQTILEEVAPTFVFTGHDHDGCIYRHNDHTVEYTIRSMMGGFGGYAGLFEIRRNPSSDPQPFSYYYTPCSFVGTTSTTVTFIVSIVYLFVLTSVRLYYSTLPVPKKEIEHESDHVDKLRDYVKQKSA